MAPFRSASAKVKVSAGSIRIDRQGSDFVTGIFSDTNESSGRAGLVEVAATGNLSIVNGGQISSNTFAMGNAGSIKVSAGAVVPLNHESGLTRGGGWLTGSGGTGPRPASR